MRPFRHLGHETPGNSRGASIAGMGATEAGRGVGRVKFLADPASCRRMPHAPRAAQCTECHHAPSAASASGAPGDDDGFSPHRQVWTQIRGYLVKRKSVERVFKWMAKQHFMGRWMTEGAEFHEGYIGEYPWGIL